MEKSTPGEIRIDTDLLVLGAGAAGCLAAYAAKERGIGRVTLVDKGALVSCGCTGAGQDHFGAHLNTGPEWDTDEAATAYYSRPGWGVGPSLVEKTFTKVVGFMLKLMEEWGVEFYKNPDGTYWRCQALGQPGPWWLMMKNGRYLKRIFARKIREAGVEVVEQVQITKLFRSPERIAGAMGFNRRTGDFHVFRAKAVVLAMGAHQSRWSTNSTRNPFNIWQNPANTGSQIVVAYNAGAKVKNLEWCTGTTLPKGFGAPGMCGFGGMGSFMRNCMEERFMQRYHELGDKAPRAFHIKAEQEEIAAGRVPLFVDSRELSDKDFEHLRDNLLSVDKHTFGDYLEQRGLDLKRDLLEVETGESSGGGNLHVDIHCESVNLKGLFGLPFSGMLSTALCGGYVAGAEAAASIEGVEAHAEISAREVREEKEAVLALREKRDGYTPKEYEDLIRQVMEHYMGHKRSLKGLNIALEKLGLIESRADELKAENFHELTRAVEALHLLKYCRLMIRSVIERKGMRGFYNLVDYPPKLDPELRDKYVVLYQVNGEQKVSFEPMEEKREVNHAA
ncbi:MAG: FAD-dependent oxidoreductase [Deltaproteobacteria bacterium]|nr:FAD-dependent oxidoreductase [Deltaproteobacteria bacterium]MBW2129123.1 FAD-dependent oxidoreductase [Deltaproteobacteria bacterium]